MAKRWICLWAALVLALMGVCLGVAVWDGVAWARTGGSSFCRRSM